MKWTVLLTTYLFVQTTYCQDKNIFFEKINQDSVIYNAAAAEISWEQSLNSSNTELPVKAANFQRKQIRWQNFVCDKLAELKNSNLLNETQERQRILLCRGPRFTFEDARKASNLYETLQSNYYNTKVCIPRETNSIENPNQGIESAILAYLHNTDPADRINNDIINNNIKPFSKNILCLNGEADFEKVISFSKKEPVLRWVWLAWRENMGSAMKETYTALVKVENRAARRNGYTDIGAAWREELEVPNLRQLCRQLYSEIRPLYTILHGVVRFFLREHYGEVVPKNGPIPAHLLGDLWSQNWQPLIDLMLKKSINLDDRIKQLDWNVEHMVKRAEDFYQSLGLPPMTDTFWRQSVFTRENNDTRCHGTAADMYRDGDFRLLYCSGTSMKDFYVIHHEMGHIQYYMAYEHKPGIFRQGANSAFHETIGDTIMYGVMTPQHLNRLGLVNDSILYVNTEQTVNNNYEENNLESNYYNKININTIFLNEDEGKTNDARFTLDDVITTDEVLMLKTALDKIPQIPFSLVIDEYRWKYFEGNINDGDLNNEFWRLALELQGIMPPSERSEEYFDVAAKFHVPDNTPYARYFLSSFLQHQLFETLCKTAVFGRRNAEEPLPKTITMNRCDIYGSKAAGKVLKNIMSRGSSQNWREILSETTGQHDISAAALRRYYQPLLKLLTRFVVANRIPIGW